MTTAPANAAFTLDAKIGRVLAEVALLPSAVQGAFRTRVYDLLSHHRLSVMKHNALPGGRRAQQMLATRLWRYTRVSTDPRAVAGVVGEGFAAADTGEDYGGSFLKQLEGGASIRAGAPMIVPVGAGREMLARGSAANAHRAWRELLRNGDTDLIRGPSGRLLLVGSKDTRGGVKQIIYGVMTRRRRQRPVLGFYRQFDDVQARHVAKFERDLDRAATAAGQEALVERAGENKTISAAYVEALKRYLDANPGRHAGARRAAQAAARLARQANLTRPGERA